MTARLRSPERGVDLRIAAENRRASPMKQCDLVGNESRDPNGFHPVSEIGLEPDC